MYVNKYAKNHKWCVNERITNMLSPLQIWTPKLHSLHFYSTFSFFFIVYLINGLILQL